jgi:hypothetical protein
MKTMIKGTLVLTLATALALGLAGCSKSEPVTPTADDANKAAAATADAAAKTAEAAKAEAAKTAEAAKAEAAKAADVAKAEAARVADAAKADAAKTSDNAKTQGLIDKAKSLVAESKFSDASSVVQQLAGLSLTSEQQKLVDGLKEQIQKALAAKATENAAGAAGNLLK